MPTPITKGVPKSYISNAIKLDFFNTSNLKTSVQNRISKNTGAEFFKQLQDLKGDKTTGVSFSEITLLALAYFYSEIFTDKKEDKHYTIEYVKGFLDANNHSPYTAIHEIDSVFAKLTDAPYFNHCWLIIQSAWFFNLDYFGTHQHIDYVNHFIATGLQLPIENYNFDKEYLKKKYNDITTSKSKNVPINGFTLVNQWYYGILFLVCKELNLPTTHFNIKIKDNREFNPLPKTSRQLRPLAPFKIIECDIKSAFPTFLDVETGANLKDHVYNNLMLSKGITRSEAKVLFNTVCNSGKYKTKQETITFFLACGYTQKQCEHLITLTHDPVTKFYAFMTEYEALAISHFTVQNQLQRGGRLHDALLFIDTKIQPTILKVHPNCDFGYKELNRPVISHSFSYGSKRLPYAFINSIPSGFNLITKHEFIKPRVKGTANGFKFYESKFEYITAGFNLNSYFEIQDEDPQDFFFKQCYEMLDTLFYFNNRKLKPFELLTILNHIRAHSNYIFNVRGVYLRLLRYVPTKSYTVKSRDYEIIENLTFNSYLGFLNALNVAKKHVNRNYNKDNLCALLQERISNNDYAYMNEIKFKGAKHNNQLSYLILRKFNLLATGRQRAERYGLNSNHIYSSSIKEITIKSLSLKPQQQNAYVKKSITSYELDLKRFNRLVNNRDTIKQLCLIVCEISGVEAAINVTPIVEVQNKIKAELMQDLIKYETETTEALVSEFNNKFPSTITETVHQINDLSNIFETDMTKSIFYQIDPGEAFGRGTQFFDEYLKFNKEHKPQESIKYVHEQKVKIQLLEFDFPN